MSQASHDEAASVAGGAKPASEMQLRPGRTAVTRLSRKVLTGLGAAVAVGIGGALFFALQPHHQAARSELYNTSNRTTPDGLANLPRDYGGLARGAPKLGPPLPGDLGGPIVKAGAPTPDMATSAAATADQQQLAQEHDAARDSHLFADANPASAVAVVSQALAGAPAAVAPPATPNDPSTEDHKLAFLNGAVDHRTVSPDRVEAPASPHVLQAGAVIEAALLTGLRSDLPGEVTAQVTSDVYDSPTGKVLLIPQGARLIGQYDAQVSFGQSRALLVWNRLIFPNGRSIVLERQPGTDAAGFAGLEDRVNNHWGMLFKAAILSTILSVGAEAGTSDAENNLAQAIRQGASQSFNRVGQQVVGRSLNVPPSITIRPGFPVRVMVIHDLVLEPYRG
ncbi:MAG TPA: TrbI/VirB10 family protein [Caulobacteraceae bacterium]